MVRRNGGFIGTDGLDAPDPPTGVTGTAGNAQVSVAFTAPTDAGTSAITGFVAQVSTNDTDYSVGSNTGTSSPIVVSSLTNDTAATAKVWAINAYGTSAPSDASASFTPSQPQRAVVAGGYATVASMDYFEITTLGDAADFGDLTISAGGMRNGCGSSTRGIFFGGGDGSGVVLDKLQYITLASTGNSTEFGDMSTEKREPMSLSNSTRAISAGTTSDYNNTLEYVTIASVGNTTDFGDMNSSQVVAAGHGAASTTRGLLGGGYKNGTGHINFIQYLTIGSTGNTVDFGDATIVRFKQAGFSNNTRAIWAGGEVAGSNLTNVIDYVTIASTGNAQDFGDLLANIRMTTGTASPTRGVITAGRNADDDTNVIQYVTIASTGNSQDFGDLVITNRHRGATSQAHGGLA